MKYIFLFGLTIALLFSCKQKQGNNKVYDMTSYEEEMPAVSRNLPPPDQPVEKIEKTETDKKKIIRDGRMSIQVNLIEKAKNRVDSLVQISGGYYANESLSNTDYASTYSLKIRIPSTNFENFILQLESGQGEIIYKNIDARDVTDEFIDLETRLNNKRNYLKRYNDLLKKATTIKEILEIEEKIRVLEEEIESTTGRLKYLSDQVAYSTLDLELTKNKEYKYTPRARDRFSERLKNSLSKGWFGFIDFLLFILKLWPLWIIVALGIYLWRKLRSKRLKNKSK